MIRYLQIILFLTLSGILTPELSAQYKLPFGDIKTEDLSNKPYKPDPGADAVVLSDIGIATLNYRDGFYVQLERDVRIRIINSNGYDRADIEIPYTTDDRIYFYRASTFNLNNGEKIETKIGKKSFFTENAGLSEKKLKFNFPDVNEGSVIEYSYIIEFRGNALYSLIPWEFQSDIPVLESSLTFSYPEPCVYKQIISGDALFVRTNRSVSKQVFLGDRINVITSSWFARDVPAFVDEPYIKSRQANLTKLTFELASLNFPGRAVHEVTPTYEDLTAKLMFRDDFGKVINTDLTDFTAKIIAGLNGNLSKLKKIYDYVSHNILWNGIDDFTASGTLKSLLRTKKGNSADINMLLIAMLRSAGIKADPVILCTRSNGDLSMFSAMIRQFNYLVAYVEINDKYYLVDATDPLRPFDCLPFSCMNDAGWLVRENGSKFVNLRNNEKYFTSRNVELKLDEQGHLNGKIKTTFSGYTAYDIRKLIRMISAEGYEDMTKSLLSSMDISGFKLMNENDPYSELTSETVMDVSNELQVAGDRMIINPYLTVLSESDPFRDPERLYPVDFGCPYEKEYTLRLLIPGDYAVISKPEDISFSEGRDNMNFDFKCSVNGNEVIVKSTFKINQPLYAVSEYDELRNFYSRLLRKQSELLILKKNLSNQ